MWLVQQSYLFSVSVFSQKCYFSIRLMFFLPFFHPPLLKMFIGIFSLFVFQMCPYYDVLFIY